MDPVAPTPTTARPAGCRAPAVARGPWAVVLVVLVALVAQLVGPASGGAAPDGVGAAQSALASARATRQAAEARLAEATESEAAIEAELAGLDDGAAQITAELAEARREVREYAVAAFIDGRSSAVFEATLDVEELVALAWRTDVMGSQTAVAAEAVVRFEDLKAANDPARVEAARRLDDAAAAVESAHSDALQAAARERDAESALARAQAAAEEARRAAEQARREAAAEQRRREAERLAAQSPPPTSGPATPAPARRVAAPAPAPPPSPAPAPPPSPAPTPARPAGRAGNPTASELAILARIRQCESGGNYGIVSASGIYRGAYQFDRRTWASVGGSGDPAAASPAEQDYRALLLLRERGRRPWPNCA